MNRAGASLSLVAALSAATGWGLATRSSGASELNTAGPATLTVSRAPSNGPAHPDPTRSGRSPTTLPDRPVLLWRRQAPSGFDRGSLVVDAQGSISAAPAKAPFLLAWSRDGDEIQRVRIGSASTVSGVALLNDGTRVVVDSLGAATGFAASGAIAFRADLGLGDRHVRLVVSPCEDGGALITGSTEVIALQRDGRVSRRARLLEPATGGAVATRRGVVVATRSGALHLLRGASDQIIGSLSGDPGEAGLSTRDGQTLHAVIDSRALVGFDMASATVHSSLAVSDQSLQGPVSFLPDGMLAAMTYTGELVRVRGAGEELPRLALEDRNTPLVTDGGRVNFAALDESPRPLTDDAGRLAFARVGGAIGVVTNDGRAVRAKGGNCPSPAALEPAGDGRFAVACRDGSVLLFGNSPP